MSTTSDNNKRIAKNTAVLYLRVVLTLFLTLFSTRYVLLGLGNEDFGTYNLIAGVVALFTFISGTMAATTQRFISYEYGATHDINKVAKVFNTSIILHLIIAIIIFIIIISVGILLIDKVLSIPPGNMGQAKIVLVSVAVGLIWTIMSVPFEATLMAHENIIFFAIIQLLGVFLKFGIALLLLIIDNNRLITYAILMAGVPLLVLLCQAIYCFKNYQETHLNKHYLILRKNAYIKPMTSFASYALFGNIGWTIRAQGFSIILNIFWGVLINAANGIANQVSAALLTFSSSLTTSIRPQLIQAAGEGNNERLIKLTKAACKYPFLILSIIGIPLFITMPYILKIWLNDVPQYSILFCRILILDVMLNQSTIGLALIMDAKGKIRLLHTLVGFSLIFTTISIYFIAQIYKSVFFVYCFIIINDLIIITIRLFIVRHAIKIWAIPFRYKRFIFDIIIKPFGVTGTLIICGLIFWQSKAPSFVWFSFTTILTIFTYLCVVWYFLFEKNEKQQIKIIFTKLKKSVLHL
jgi:putative phospholipid-translocating ATPase